MNPRIAPWRLFRRFEFKKEPYSGSFWCSSNRDSVKLSGDWSVSWVSTALEVAIEPSGGRVTRKYTDITTQLVATANARSNSTHITIVVTLRSIGGVSGLGGKTSKTSLDWSIFFLSITYKVARSYWSLKLHWGYWNWTNQEELLLEHRSCHKILAFCFHKSTLPFGLLENSPILPFYSASSHDRANSWRQE